MADIRDVGLYIDAHADCSGDLMKLFKLTYYAQAWHLAWHGSPLFDDAIEAWKAGPVPRTLWNYYKYQSSTAPGAGFSDSERATIDAVLAFYGALDGPALSRGTHRESPWLNARKNLSPQHRSTEIITQAAMQAWATRESLAHRGPTYDGPLAEPGGDNDREAISAAVLAEDRDILRALASL